MCGVAAVKCNLICLDGAAGMESCLLAAVHVWSSCVVNYHADDVVADVVEIIDVVAVARSIAGAALMVLMEFSMHLPAVALGLVVLQSSDD